MNRRSIVVLADAGSPLLDRVTAATAVAFPGPDAPVVRRADPGSLPTDDADPDRLADACGVVTTASVLSSAVEDTAASSDPFGRLPGVVVVPEGEPEAVRTAFRAGAADTVGPFSGSDPESDPLVARLAATIGSARNRLSDPGLERLTTVLLDAATTLMSTRSDEVKTKIEWTMESVGERAELDRIVCYLDGDDGFSPEYYWSPNGFSPTVRAFDDFPEPDRLSTFENVSVPAVSADGGGAPASGTEDVPPATVHVPLVTEWELTGVVSFEVDGRRSWTEREVNLYRTLADLIASAVTRNERRMELRTQAERLEQFSAVVSHDLRNPLNVLSGYLDLAADDVRSRHYDAMENAVDRMETLIDDLLMLARRGETIGETETVPVASLAEEAWESVRAPNATLTVADGTGRVEADPGRFRQALENLFRNAVDHGGPEVAIEVGPRVGSDGVVGMYVSDDGPGVSPDVRESVFDSGFSTADSSGIGLAIVDRVAEAHDWTVDVHNDDGAVFEFDLEMAPPRTVPQ
ncbi:sensor histidine kinase [Halorubrum halodurans]|uniref:histidine kinase n=1 Tax=Halorubrum halodurans TaxID=1383851 RepID=A0A256IMJ0_9EURY|nr:GAF domain-containing sensor histidine kinase [Halorubrum halodurans]OYR57347.1 histidine kinase [Halorubrum halodurans]